MITTEQPNVKNGVNVDQLVETVKLVQSDPSMGDFQFRGKTNWIDGGHCVTSVKSFYGAGQEDETRTETFTMECDHAPVLLGNDVAANPAETVLHALGSCLIGAMAYHAAAQGIDIESMESKLEGDVNLQGFLGIDPEVRKGFSGITVKFKVKSDATDEQLKALSQFSPVFDIISNPTPVKIEFER
ncbi:OsmC family protein [Aegicerativicinus sediminis]|uniref:OsmC family protein n=1 Tax=Aegicerativicinus sediminis TaxID=2893202 RepID=UPI001E28CBDA|nr:OsmC family protein [Aegicerativicinus sediminis]